MRSSPGCCCASIVVPTFEAPAWVMPVFTVFLALGFPLVLVFAWAYELTPTGLARTKDVPLEESITHVTGQRLNYVIAGLKRHVIFEGNFPRAQVIEEVLGWLDHYLGRVN